MRAEISEPIAVGEVAAPRLGEPDSYTISPAVLVTAIAPKWEAADAPSNRMAWRSSRLRPGYPQSAAALLSERSYQFDVADNVTPG